MPRCAAWGKTGSISSDWAKKYLQLKWKAKFFLPFQKFLTVSFKSRVFWNCLKKCFWSFFQKVCFVTKRFFDAIKTNFHFQSKLLECLQKFWFDFFPLNDSSFCISTATQKCNLKSRVRAVAVQWLQSNHFHVLYSTLSAGLPLLDLG